MRAQVAHKRSELLSDPATDERERKAKAALMTKIEAWLAEDVGRLHAHSRRLASRRVSSDTIIVLLLIDDNNNTASNDHDH